MIQAGELLKIEARRGPTNYPPKGVTCQEKLDLKSTLKP